MYANHICVVMPKRARFADHSVERQVRNLEVRGSNPLCSTKMDSPAVRRGCPFLCNVSVRTPDPKREAFFERSASEADDRETEIVIDLTWIV